MSEDFKMIILPSDLNPNAPIGESLILVFTIGEMERARVRGESIINNRMRKGVSRDDAIKQCIDLC